MIELRRDGIAGEYMGQRTDSQLVLRVDVGGDGALDVVSGDLLFENGPDSFEHHHSFQTTGLVLEDHDDRQILRSAVKVHASLNVTAARLDLDIPDEGELLATYTFFRLTSFGRETVLTLTFPLQRTSAFFRRVELEMDQVVGVPLPEPFATDSHPETPSAVADRQLTFGACFRNAGVDLAVTVGGEDIPVTEAGLDGLWTDEELHGAMVNHFAEHRDEPQWRLYLLLATRYESPSTLGILFDSGDDFPRQGVSVFAEHPAIANAPEAERNREYLYTIVHEMGHAFNMLHSFQKGLFETHGVLPRPSSLSWMNYPQLYPFGFARPSGWDGSSRFWSEFPFVFDRNELAHVRHNDSLEVIMGGESFGFAGHLEERPFQQVAGGGDLSLFLWLPEAVEFMQQVEGDVRLRNESGEPLQVHGDLHPAAGHLELRLRRPGDRFPKVYRHLYQACTRAETVELGPGEALYRELRPSFGSRHWFIDEPGTYEVQAVYTSVDGRRVASQIRQVRVVHPSAEADRLAPDYFSQEVGTYLGLEGSRIDALSGASDTLEEVRRRLPETEVAHQVSRTKALCETRVFKDVRKGEVMRPDRAKAAGELMDVLGIDPAKKKIPLRPDEPHLLVGRMMMRATRAYAAEGATDEAKAVANAHANLLRQVKAPAPAKAEMETMQTEIGL